MEKYEKVASFPRQGRKILCIYSLYSLPDLKRDRKCFIHIPSLNFLDMRALGTFSQFYQVVTMEMMTVREF